jgi:predicted TIM-barrel fold metal-dependent hydrolase
MTNISLLHRAHEFQLKPRMMHRRNFLKRGVALVGASALLTTRSSQAGSSSTPSGGDKSGGFIDVHVHVWTNDLERYPLAPGFTRNDMQPSTFLPEDILRQARPSGVNRIVLIQMSYYRFDNSYMLDVIRHSPGVFRGVAVIDKEGSHPDLVMRELKKRGVRGFRIVAGGTRGAPSFEDEGFDKMFRCASEERLAMCPLIDPDALPALAKQCERFPDMPVAIDHLAHVGAQGRILESEVQALCAMAKYPQVYVKVSAFYALGLKRPPHEDLAPLIRRVYEAYGPQRMMWGSDCPYQVMKETYEDGISLVRDHLSFLSAEDKEWILRRTAESVFFGD